MRISGYILFTFIALGAPRLLADGITPHDLTAPFAVQPSAGLLVTSGMTGPFFSVLASPPFTAPGIVDVLANIEAIDSNGNPISVFHVTAVTITQSSKTVSPPLETFSTASPVIYTDTLNPFNSVTVSPTSLNLAFNFLSDSSFQYSYFLDVSGIPDGGFLLYDDIEGASVPEPSSGLLVAAGLALLAASFGGRCRSRAEKQQHSDG
jgi:hypothetical protein